MRLGGGPGKRSALALVAPVVLVSVLAACGGGSSAPSGSIGTGGGTITSSDGLATLSVPPGALSSNQSIQVALTAGAWPADLSDLSPIEAYQLLPSGLHFSRPAQLTLRLPTNGAASVLTSAGVVLPTLISQDGSSLEALTPSLKADVSAKSATLSVPISHFSKVYVGGALNVVFDPSSVSTLVGNGWKMSTQFIYGYSAEAKSILRGKSTSFDLTNIRYISSAPVSVVGAATHPDVHETSQGSITGTLDDQAPSFNCDAVGTGSYGIVFDWQTEVSNSAGRRSGSGAVTGGASCTPKPTTTTSSSTTSTTVTPTTATQYPAAITAYFDQGAFSTYYTEPIYNPSWSYTWSVSIPVDPDCGQGFHGSAPTPDKATWKHSDTSEGGTCNHSGQDYNNTTGHPGTVTLVVTPPDKSWHCEMLFYGTAPNNQDPRNPAVGNNPQCQHP